MIYARTLLLGQEFKCPKFIGFNDKNEYNNNKKKTHKNLYLYLLFKFT